MIEYRVYQGINNTVMVACQECGTEMVFTDGVRLEDIGNAVTAHETDADESGCKYARAAVGAITPMLPMWHDYDGKCPNGCPMCTPEARTTGDSND